MLAAAVAGAEAPVWVPVAAPPPLPLYAADDEAAAGRPNAGIAAAGWPWAPPLE